jgi:hypothetical protein
MSKPTLKEIWEQGERHISPSRRKFGVRFAVWGRLISIAAGTIPVFLAIQATTGKYLFDDAPFYLGAITFYWLVASAWVLAGMAAESGGWGDLEITEIVVMPVAVLSLILAPIGILVAVAFGQMH